MTFERSTPKRTVTMNRREDLAQLLRALDGTMVLSVYLARENEDPGKGPAWLKRLEVALGALRSDIEATTPGDLPAFDRALDRLMTGVESFGRILPHEGWCAFATEDDLRLTQSLPYRPQEMVRWRSGATIAPYVRALKVERPAVLAVLSSLHADLYRYEEGELSEAFELHAEWPPAESGDVGVSNRAARVTGVRGVTATDYTKRAQDENVRRHQRQLEDALHEMVGRSGMILLGGTQKAIRAVRRDLEETFAGRVAELPELAFDSCREELLAHVRTAASQLTEERQAALLDGCADPHHGTMGWNETYRALAAGAVDRMLVARGMIESEPDEAERLVRLALAQGAEVEEVGGEVGSRLMGEAGGVAARLRFVPASLIA